MNLITCAEDCEFQREGYCRLTGGAPVSAVPVNGCSYYRPRAGGRQAGRESPAGETGRRPQ